MSTPSQFGPSTPPPKRSSGSSVLIIILIIFGVLLLSCAGICGGCALWTRSAAQSGMAYVELLPTMESAVSAAQNDPQVTSKLGEPVEISSLPARTGKGELTANEDFECDLRGPNGTAKLKGSASKADGFWKVTAITVQTSDGSTFTVPPPTTGGGTVEFQEVPEMPEETK